MRRKILITISIFSLNFLLNSCAGGKSAAQTATPEIPTPTPAPLRNLTICLGYEPSSLYLYGTNSQATWSVLEAIYDGPIDTRNYQPVPVILEKMPAFDDSDAAFQPLGVQAGDEILDADGNLITLTEGVELYPRGCTSPDCILTWDGTSQLQMDQLVVTYKLLPDLKWSDGVPLTAADSVYSFQLASDPATPVVKRTSDQVASYQALDALTVQMVSKPGLVTDMFEKYFWTPLPQHVWGEYTAEELLTAEVSTRTPLGWGAYVIEEWIPGEAIRLKKNLEYFRADEGLPKFDFLEFKVIGKDQNILDMVQTGNCDIVDNSGIPYKDYGKLVEENQNGEIKLFAMESKEWEILAFGIKPASYDDGYYPYGSDRPDIFGDLRVRQAFAQCINRERILKDFLYDLPELPRAYLRSSHPLYGLVQPLSCYDPQQGIRFLEDAGWLDQDLNPATPRIAYGVANVPDGTKLIVNYFLSDALLRKMVAEDIANSLGQCGVQVNLETIPINDLYVSGPDGIIFGRGFDLAQLSWVIGNQPPCELFESEEIPSKDNFWLGRDNGGGNITGYSNPVYDESCRLAHRAGMNLDLYLSSQTAEANLLVDQVPVIPLYFHPQLLVARMDLCDINLDDSAISTFNSLEEWDLGNACSAFGWCWLTKLHCQSVLSDIK